MTNVIQQISQSTSPELEQTQTAPNAGSPLTPNNTLVPGEIVTLSAAATETTKLLDAARQADGIDHETVAQIRSALQNGTYNVSPEDLAHAIASVLRDTQG